MPVRPAVPSVWPKHACKYAVFREALEANGDSPEGCVLPAVKEGFPAHSTFYLSRIVLFSLKHHQNLQTDVFAAE